MERDIVMATIRKQGRAIKRLVPRVPTSAHDPEHKADMAWSPPEPEKVNRKHGNRHDRRKAAALARQMAKGPS